MSFTDELWGRVEGTIIKAIESHPFITGMTDGTLSEDIFRNYIVQDHKYLDVFSRLLSMLAAKSTSAATFKMFASSALHVGTVETQLHDSLLKSWGVTDDDIEATPMQPTCLAYTSYLDSIVMGQAFHRGVAAILPCYWIYQHVGHFLKEKGSVNPKYQSWIDMYGGEDFDEAVQRMLELMNTLALSLTDGEKRICLEHFEVASRYEYMFWDGPWQQEAWPC